MDHLPTVPPAFQHPDVPYLYNEAHPYIYDNDKDLFHFPKRMGWDVDQFLSGTYDDEGHNTPAKAASLIQAWLYFGLSHMITGIPIETQDFLRTTASKSKVINTAKLPRILGQWKQSIAVKTQKEQLEYEKFLDSRFDAFKPYLSLLCNNDCLAQEVRYSMCILQSTFRQMKMAMFPTSTRDSDSALGDFDKAIKARLFKDGWCKSQVTRLFQQLSMLTLYYMSTLGPHFPDRDHCKCGEFDQCVATTNQPRVQKLMHTSSDCVCDFFEVRQEQLDDIIAHDRIPLLRLSMDGQPEILEYDILKDNSSLDYVAISHLWSDGLGVPSSNIMSICQFQKIYHRVELVAAKYSSELVNHGQSSLFWIDTLCIPGTEGQLKTKAIAMMERVYRKAKVVLVLESSLEALSAEEPLAKRLLQIASAAWYTRLWTLQEGIFAKELEFQFRDHSINIIRETTQKSLLRLGEDCGEVDIADLIIRDIVRFLTDTSLSTVRNEEGRSLFRRTTWRFTTRSSDEAVCLCILLGLEVSKIHELPEDPDIRMKVFIRMQKYFPSSILFSFENGGGFDEDGFRWAPKTFLGRVSGGEGSLDRKDEKDYKRNSSTPDSSFADESGLHSSYFGMELNLQHGFRAWHSNPQRLDILNENDMFAYSMMLTSTANLAWNDVSRWNRPAVIVPRPLSSKNRMSLGVLVFIHAKVDDQLFCHCRSRILVWLYARPCSDKDALQFVKNHARLTYRSENQKWCVG